MTPLEELIREIIAAEGPMRLDRYMALCLGHPEHGYYAAREPFGESGDFITAPEVSQVFGELIGIWCANVWMTMAAPPAFNLVELGPGRGTLMADMLRAAKVVPGFRQAAQVHFVETSVRLRDIQRQAVPEAVWHESLSAVPEGPVIVVANEFFDAIPIRQFEFRKGGWHERCVGLEGGRLAIGLAETHSLSANGHDGDIIEMSPMRGDIARDIGRRLAGSPGAALIIDYGHLESAPGDTLQAMRRHGFAAITDEPGHCDLTSHVDFEALANGLREGGATVRPVLTQRAFLMAMGLEARIAALSVKADEAMRGQLQRASARLAGETQMGNLFKVLAAGHPGLAVPYPFGAP